MENTLKLAKTKLSYEGGVLVRTDPQGATLMSLPATRFGKLRVEMRLQAGGLVFLIPALAMVALTARYADQSWVEIIFYTLAAFVLVAVAAGLKGPCLVIPSVGGQGDLVIQVSERQDEVEAFAFSVNESRKPDADLAPPQVKSA